MRKLIIKILLILTIFSAYGQIKNEAPFKILKGHQYKVMYLRFSSDGKYLASCGWDNTVRVWDMKTFSELHVLKEHSDWIREIDISLDNNFVVSGSQDGSFIVWDLKSGELKHKEKISPQYAISKFNQKMPNGVSSVAFSPNGKLLSIGAEDELIRIYDLKTYKLLHLLDGHKNDVFYIIFNKTGEFIVSGAIGKELIIWDTKTFEPLHVLNEDKGYNGSFKFFHDDKYLINTGKCSINIWDISKGIIIRSIQVQCELQSVDLTPDEKFMVTCAEDHTVKLWDFETGEELWCYINPKQEVADCKISPDGKYIAVATPESNILIWKISELIENK